MSVGVAQAYDYTASWTGDQYVDFVRIASSGEGIVGSQDTSDITFVKLKAAVINPANCGRTSMYAFVPAASNAKDGLMYSTLLAAAMAGKKVNLAISNGFCDYGHPTVYDVKISF